MEQIATALFLAVAVKAIVDYLANPIRQKFTELDFWWLVYVALAVGFIVSWFAGINLFDATIAEPLAGRILTGLVVGGGSSLIHDIFGSNGTEISVEPVLIEAETP